MLDGFFPQGFGVRQSSAVFSPRASDAKAAEGCRTPGRWREMKHLRDGVTATSSLLCRSFLFFDYL
jgi:hypothetical protein